MTERIIRSVEELPAVAEELLRSRPEARVFAFYGELGAGKTTLIKAVCKALRAQDIVQSPSFAIINEYRLPDGEPVFHFDFYRIRKLEEVYDLGYEDYFFSGHYCLIEWPELTGDLLPEGTVKVSLSGAGDRVITW